MRYAIIVNGECIVIVNSYEEALNIEDEYYSCNDEDFINYYGNFPNVKILEIK